MPQPVSYNTGTPVSGSIQESIISYVVDGQQRDYRGGYNGLAWMSEAPATNNVIFIGNTTSVGRGPANTPLFYPSFNNSEANIVYAANKLPGSPGNFSDTASAYDYAIGSGFFINNSDNPIPRIDADELTFYVDANQPGSYPQTGTSVYDLSGRNNTGTLINGTVWDSNGWFDFDGVDDYIDCGSGMAATGKITVNALVKLDTFSNPGGSSHIVDSSDNSWHLAVLTNGVPYFWNGTTYHTTGTPLSTDRWYMLTGVQGTTLDIYVNGELNNSLNSNLNIATNNVWIGAYTITNRFLNGQVSNVQIYPRALTTTEIKQNYFQSNIVTDGLVFMVDANNLISYPKSDNRVYNLIGGTRGDLINGVGFNNNNGGNWTFDGVDDDIRITLFTNARTNITMAGWVYVNLGTVGTFLNNGDDPGGYCIGIGQYFSTADNQIVGLFGAIRWILTGAYYQYTGWHHVVMTLDGSGTPSIYVNGVLIGTYPGSISNIPSPGTGFSIGSQWGIRYANMKCGNSNFYNRELTAAEIQQNYQETKDKFLGQTIVTNGLLLNLDAANKDSYPGTGTTWYTLAGSNNGTLNGSPTYNTIVGGTFQFNGPSSFDYVSVSDTITHKTGQSFSYECWVYFNGLSGFDKTIVGKPGCNIGLMQAGSSMGMAVFGPNGVCAGGNTQYYAAGTSNTGVWEHWIGTYEVGVGIKSFKNGTLVSSVPVTGNIGNWGDTLYIGGSINSNYTGECYIAYTSTYSIALNQNQVTQNFNALRNRFGV
jgi:hypothetical protein